MDRNRKQPTGVRVKTVNKSCNHAVIKFKMYHHWYDGDWIYVRFEVHATGNYLISEAILLTRQWQKTYAHGRAPLIIRGSHEYNATRLHAIKAIETMRKKFGDQGELFD